MNGTIWVILGFLLIATTKYLTSLRLRNLQEKMQREHQTATNLKQTLERVAQQEIQIKEDIEKVQARLTTMRNIVGNLERVVQKHTAVAQ